MIVFEDSRIGDFDGKKVISGYRMWMDELHSTYESLNNANLDKKERVRAGKKRHELWMIFYPVVREEFGYARTKVPDSWYEARNTILEAYKMIENGTEYGWEDKVA